MATAPKPQQPSLDAALKEAIAAREATKKRAGRDDGYKISYGLSDADAAQAAFKKYGIDSALIPKNLDLSFYGKLQSLAGGKLDPRGALSAATYYDDGRSKANEEQIPELVAQGVFQGKTGAELWKPVEAWNDSQRGKKEGWGAVENFATGAAKAISSNPLAQMAISAAAGAMGVPPNVTMAFLAANDVGQGKKLEDVAKNIALQYAGGKLGDMAKGATGTAIQGMGLGETATKGLTNAASSATKQLLSTGKVDAKGLLTSGLTNAAKGYAGDAISGFAKDQGWDSLNFDNFSIPGGLDLSGNLVPGVSAGNANTALNLINKTPLGAKIAPITAGISLLKNPSVAGFNNLVNPAARPAPRGARPAPVAKTPPTGTRPPLGKRPPLGG